MMKLNSLQAIKRISASRIARNFCTSDSRYKEITPPFNWGIQIVPERTAFVIERFGKYHKTLYSGIHFLPPFINKIAFVQPLKEVVIKVEDQRVVTEDGGTINLDTVIYMQIIDPVKASYAFSKNPFDVSVDMARYVIAVAFGKVNLDTALKNKGNENLSVEIMGKFSKEVHDYGLKCSRFLIRNLYMSPASAQSMEMLADVEHKWLSAAVLPAIVPRNEAKQCTAFLEPNGSVMVHTCTHHVLNTFVTIGWINRSRYCGDPYKGGFFQESDDGGGIERTIDLKDLLMEDLQECLDLIGMRLVDFSIGWEKSNRVNVSFQMDDTVAIDDRVKKVKPLIEAAIPYTFQDFSRWKPSIQYMISKMPIDPEVSHVLNMMLDLAASYSSRNQAMEVDEIEIEPTKIYIVMTMARVTRGAATAALKSNKGDIVRAIQELTRSS